MKAGELRSEQWAGEEKREEKGSSRVVGGDTIAAGGGTLSTEKAGEVSGDGHGAGLTSLGGQGRPADHPSIGRNRQVGGKA